jgi:hypothetical protein
MFLPEGRAMTRKVYVKVVVEVTAEGVMTPKKITWDNGKIYEIDKVNEVRRAASLRAGGTGIRYTSIINEKPYYLFYEDPQWFMEGKEKSIS